MLALKVAFSSAVDALLSKVPWQIWAALGVVALLGASAWYIDKTAFSRGYAAADTAWVEKVEAEIDRQTEANRQALQQAQDRIARLEEAKAVRDAHIERLSREAEELPTADRPAVSTDGVRILNSVLD